ncbi:MAG TPA: TatD family deoxyribonuclease [Solibacterales bacterium]|nr:TatD family deoxyribonuclease [Bryobacterales bacterium]
MNLVDSHCHLDDERFAGEIEAVVDRALAAGVRQMVSIGTGDGPPDLEAGIRIAEMFAPVWATVGIHPHNATQSNDAALARLELLAKHSKVVAVGEIGLDYHYDFAPRDVQRRVFAEQLRIAAAAGKPVVIHTREAWDDTFAVLEEHWRGGGIMHCFSGGPQEARRSLALGFHLSFAGIVTFPKAVGVQQAARETPIDRLLVETDAPYLSPAPHRGKRNEPSFVTHTAAKVAELRGETIEAVARATTRNWERLCLPHASGNE